MRKRPTRVVNKGYGDAGASQTKRSLKGFKASSGSPREDIDFHNFTLRQRARMLYMAAPLATSAIKTNRTNVIGAGLRLSSRIDREELGLTAEAAAQWQHKAEKEFALWAENRLSCDALGLNDFYELQQIAFQAWLLSGDVFCLFKFGKTSLLNPYSTRLHLIEADRVSTPTKSLVVAAGVMIKGKNTDTGNDIFDGVEVDSDGRVVAYFIRNTYPYEFTDDTTEWKRVEAVGKTTGMPNILHIMDAERPDQYRGVTYLAPVIEPLLQLRRYTETELTAAVIESCYAGFLLTEANPDDMPMNETATADNEPTDPNEFNFGPGEFNVLKPGEDVKFTDPKRPANGFGSFVEAVATQVGSALEIPKEVLFKAFNSSYSASRGAILEAWKMFRMRRDWFVKDFCRPVYEAWLAEAVATGRIQAPGFFADPVLRKAWCGSEWVGPSQGQLNPVQEIQAEIYAIEHGFSTHEQSTARLNGGNWQKNIERLAREREAMPKAE